MTSPPCDITFSAVCLIYDLLSLSNVVSQLMDQMIWMTRHDHHNFGTNNGTKTSIDSL